MGLKNICLSLSLVSGLAITPFSANADFEDAKKLYTNKAYDKAFTEIKSLAEMGHLEAQFMLAESYEHGYGTEQDVTLAYSWYLIARDNKHPDAKKKYASLRKSLPSRREAKETWRNLDKKFGENILKKDLYPVVRPVSFNHANYVKTVHVEPDYPSFVQDGKVSAWTIMQYDINENGRVDNIKVLASLPKKQLSPYIVEAMEQWRFNPPTDIYGEPRRIEGLTIKYETTATKRKQQRKFSSLQENYVSQMKQYRDLGDSYYQYKYGLLVEHGIVTDDKPALDYYLAAAINGYSEAQFKLAQCTLDGSWCEKDQTKAINWLTHAAKNQHVKAAYRLAMEFLNYENVVYDPRKAVDLLKLATLKGYIPAIAQYASILAVSDDPEIRNPADAIKYAEQARTLDPNNPMLLSTLGIAYSELGRYEKGESLLNEAIQEASRRKWSVDNYLDLLEDYKPSMVASGL
ncbi:energy transducer TonB [Flocculibacter collagenilyticus]|uniref:energy transducer TonB n=1 Tax=Flocculibacter collagenilyticus TaxID=2744479 RepID=UPI0018F43395|nr:energy transducer TonB [Flocculibacter collagenilyticus]